MKRLGFKLNLADDTLEVNGKKLDLDTTTSGHYYIPLKTCELPLESVNMVIENKSHGEKTEDDCEASSTVLPIPQQED